MALPNNPKQYSYVAPIANTDGSPLALSDIAYFELGIGTTSKNYTTVVKDATIEASGPQVSAIAWTPALGYGTFFSAVRAVSKANATSDWSNEVSFTEAPPVPQAPTGFTVA